jgi:hypothetical protein
MSISSHSQRIGSRRSTVIAAVAATAIGLAAFSPPALHGSSNHVAGPLMYMPGGGCGATGC